MKPNKKAQHQQRQILDLKLNGFSTRPTIKKGWVKSVRNALGISSRQLAELMGVTQTNITQLENGESKKTVSLKSLSKAAEAMDCELVYMIVPKSPNNSFDELLDQKAVALAKKIASGVPHSMNLEMQEVDSITTQDQIKNLAHDLKRDLDSGLWKKSKK
ncbi:MAG: mobile mystery protein A [Bdellovibrionota bacterium]